VGPYSPNRSRPAAWALGVFNNDGAVDVLISVNDGAPLLLRNNIGRQKHRLGLRRVGRNSNPDAIGARISYQSGDLKRSHMKVGGGRFLSSHHPAWCWDLAAPLDRYIAIVEGKGQWQ
jgi:enediyne biosynthesis protein E4